MFWFAWKTLAADRGKVLAALAGVVFSVVLVSVQGGLYFGLIGKASLLVDHCTAEIWVGHHGVDNVDLPECIPLSWINRVRSVPGVAAADPYLLASGTMTLQDGTFEAVWIVGSDRSTLAGSAWSLPDSSLAALRRPDSIIVDAADDQKLGSPQLDEVLEINGRRARVVGKTHGIQNFMTTPVVFTTIETARGYARIAPDRCSYLLVRTETGANPDRLVDDIQRVVPDATVQTADRFRTVSQEYWMRRTGIGLSFGVATLLGLLVGMLMVMQSLYALALDHLSEYAALKAIGATDRQIGAVVCRQALSIAAIGSTIGIVLALCLQRAIDSPVAPVELSAALLCGSVSVVFVICLVATALPLIRVRRLDPTVVLQG